MDFGTGGGLPGIPIAIARPDLSLCLVDSIQKKAKMVSAMIEQLPLLNASVVASRAEDLHLKEGERFQLVIARAVAPLVDLLKWSTNLFNRRDRMKVLIHDSGRVEEATTPMLLAMKGGELEDELKAATLRYPAITPIVVRFPGVPLASEALDDKKVLVIQR